MAEPDGAEGGGRLGIFGDRGFVDYFLSYISSRAAFQVANELRETRRELVPLLNQAKDIADIKSRMERIEAKVT